MLARVCPKYGPELEYDAGNLTVPPEHVFMTGFVYSNLFVGVRFHDTFNASETKGVSYFNHSAADASVAIVSDFLEQCNFFRRPQGQEGGTTNAEFPTLLEAYSSFAVRQFRADLWKIAILFACGGLYLDDKFSWTATRRTHDLLLAQQQTTGDNSTRTHRAPYGGGLVSRLLGPPVMSQTKHTRGRTRAMSASELGLCVEKQSRGHMPYWQTSLIVSPPRTAFLLIALRLQIENARTKYKGRERLDPTGPGMLSDAFSLHPCLRAYAVPLCMFAGRVLFGQFTSLAKLAASQADENGASICQDAESGTNYCLTESGGSNEVVAESSGPRPCNGFKTFLRDADEWKQKDELSRDKRVARLAAAIDVRDDLALIASWNETQHHLTHALCTKSYGDRWRDDETYCSVDAAASEADEDAGGSAIGGGMCAAEACGSAAKQATHALLFGTDGSFSFAEGPPLFQVWGPEGKVDTAA
eukprot:g13110.t1